MWHCIQWHDDAWGSYTCDCIHCMRAQWMALYTIWYAFIPCYTCTHACVDTAIHASMHPSPSNPTPHHSCPFSAIPYHSIYLWTHLLAVHPHRRVGSPLSAHGSIHSFLGHSRFGFGILWSGLTRPFSLSLNCTLTPVGKVLDGLPRNIKCQLHPCYQ